MISQYSDFKEDIGDNLSCAVSHEKSDMSLYGQFPNKIDNKNIGN